MKNSKIVVLTVLTLIAGFGGSHLYRNYAAHKVDLGALQTIANPIKDPEAKKRLIAVIENRALTVAVNKGGISTAMTLSVKRWSVLPLNNGFRRYNAVLTGSYADSHSKKRYFTVYATATNETSKAIRIKLLPKRTLSLFTSDKAKSQEVLQQYYGVFERDTNNFVLAHK